MQESSFRNEKDILSIVITMTGADSKGGQLYYPFKDAKVTDDKAQQIDYVQDLEPLCIETTGGALVGQFVVK